MTDITTTNTLQSKALGERNGRQTEAAQMSTSPATFSTLSPPPRSVKRRYAAAYAATAFQIALTTNRRPGSLNAYRGQTPRCARLRDVHRLHSEQCKGEFFPCTGLKILALETPSGSLSALPLVCPRATAQQARIRMRLWTSMDAAGIGWIEEKGMEILRSISVRSVCRARPDHQPAIQEYKF